MNPVSVPALLALPDGTSPIAIVPFVAAVLVTIALFVRRPPVTKTAVLSILPWALAAAGLRAYATTAALPAVVRPLYLEPQVHLATFAVAGVAWIAIGGLSAARRPPTDPSYHLVAIGAGAAVVVLAGAVANGSVGGLDRIVVLPMVVIAAGGVAGAVYVAFGVLYTDVPVYTGLAGGLVVFGHALEGVATALEVSSFEDVDSSWVASAAVELAARLPLGGHLGVDHRYVVVWMILWVKLAFGVLVVASIARYARERPSRATVALGGVAAAGIVPGATTLLLVLGGG